MKALRLISLAAIFCCFFSTTRAQYVTIPDSAFRVFLTNNYPPCMNGNQLDTTCPYISRPQDIYVDYKGIKDLYGIQFFDSLNDLYCGNNDLTTLPPLPKTLSALWAGNNKLTSLPALPSALKILNLSGNRLTSCPALPLTLRDVYFSSNLIDSLPSLPPLLSTLQCRNNTLTRLPTLPDSITYLDCANNNISSIPPLPSALRGLDVSDNNLSALPPLPDSLTLLAINNNNFISVPNLPATIITLECERNSISSLPVLPARLNFLSCGSNPISYLPPLPSTLAYLWCSYNFLTSLPALPPAIVWLNCSGNNLSSIPPLSDSLYVFDCRYNPQLHCLPRLAHIGQLFFDSANIRCLPNFGVVWYSIPPISAIPLCTPGNASGCQTYWNLSGTVYNDSTGDCLQQSGETNLPYLKVNLRQSGNVVQQTYTAGYGIYTFQNDTGNYTIDVDTTGLPFNVICPAGGIDTVNVSALDSLQNHSFALRCKPGFDVAVQAIASNSVFRPARFNTVQIKAGDAARFYNQSCNTIGLGGQLVTTITGSLSYVSPAPNALTPIVSGNTLTYTIANWAAINPDSAFNIITQTDTTAQGNTFACFAVSATPTAGDNDSLNNNYSFCFPVVNSFDPNDKAVYPAGGIDENGSRWLTYTVRFQNTGNAPAENIFITDTLDSDLEVETFQLLSYSFQPSVIVKGNAVKFTFNNINLPDSVNDEPNSHGYVQYKVKIKGNAGVGTSVANTAFIYFDYNAPVVTNTTTNTITTVIGITTISSGIGTMQVYPNPAQNVVMINLSDNLTGGSLTLTDVTGRILNTVPVTALHNELNTAALSSGVYLLAAIKGGDRVVQRLVVSK